ncbi:MAG: GNAT family N-acetyltransferase [Pseudomonadota bacterium]
MLRTARLTLRPALESDLEQLHRIFTDPRAMRYWDRPPNTSRAQTKRFLQGFMARDPDRKLEYILDLDGVCIGKAGMWAKPEVGFILHPDHWQKGYATEAMRAILPLIWERFPGLQGLTAELDPRNSASAALLQKLGFRLDRVEEKNFLYGESEWCDTAYYVLARPPAERGALTTNP